MIDADFNIDCTVDERRCLSSFKVKELSGNTLIHPLKVITEIRSEQQLILDKTFFIFNCFFGAFKEDLNAA